MVRIAIPRIILSLMNQDAFYMEGKKGVLKFFFSVTGDCLIFQYLLLQVKSGVTGFLVGYWRCPGIFFTLLSYSFLVNSSS